VAITNYYRAQQESYQSLQDYHDQFMAYRKVCEQLGLKVGTSENGRRNMLKRMNIINPTQQQKEEAEKKAIEEHHVVLFMLGDNKYKYGKLLEDLKNNIGRKKIHFQNCLRNQNGRITREANTTTTKVNPMMVLPWRP